MKAHYEVVRQGEVAMGPDVVFLPQGVAGGLPGDEILLHVAIDRYEQIDELIDVINEILFDAFETRLGDEGVNHHG